MNRCSSCGARPDPGDKFCIECGERLSAPGTERSPESGEGGEWNDDHTEWGQREKRDDWGQQEKRDGRSGGQVQAERSRAQADSWEADSPTAGSGPDTIWWKIIAAGPVLGVLVILAFAAQAFELAILLLLLFLPFNLGALLAYPMDASAIQESRATAWEPKGGLWSAGHFLLGGPFVAVAYVVYRRHKTGVP